jgi:hypothetical protein
MSAKAEIQAFPHHRVPGTPVASDPDQGVTVRLSDIKEEARARRQHVQRLSSAPGDSR